MRRPSTVWRATLCARVRMVRDVPYEDFNKGARDERTRPAPRTSGTRATRVFSGSHLQGRKMAFLGSVLESRTDPTQKLPGSVRQGDSRTGIGGKVLGRCSCPLTPGIFSRRRVPSRGIHGPRAAHGLAIHVQAARQFVALSRRNTALHDKLTHRTRVQSAPA